MRRLKKKNEGISTVLTFALVPLSGFAMDVYIPSFPHMAYDLQTSESNIKLTLTLFIVSYGISQLFVGSISDSFGRYKINIISLIVLILSSLGIALSSDLTFILGMRFIQGIAISFIAVCKRSFFVDVYTGDKRKHYTSLVTVVWSAAPILAPFLGGFLQESFGWRANFYFLALYASIMLVLEWIYSGETIREKHPFKLRYIFSMYDRLMNATDFSLGIIVLGLSYSMVMVFGMSIPFIVEHEYHLSALYSGYCALISGLAIFGGGFLSKKLVNKPLYNKLQLANISQLLIVAVMLFTASIFHQLYIMMLFVFLIHFWQGFTYNTYFTYAITSQPKFSATGGGLAGGGSFIVFSITSYLVGHLITISDQWTLGLAYLIFLLSIQFLLYFVRQAIQKTLE
ncbi:MFS transporter [Sphingobacterium siyangense]|uniref:MFS transporter n=1 Tax=Sphingobacterium siyangense TaxID=459529 RepID=UPI003C728F92